MSAPIVHEGKLYVFREFLKDYGVSASYLDKQTSLARTGRTRFYRSLNWEIDKRFSLIEYRTIPKRTEGSLGHKYKLPTDQELYETYISIKKRQLEEYQTNSSQLLTYDVQLEMEKDHRRIVELIAEFAKGSDYDYYLQTKYIEKEISQNGKKVKTSIKVNLEDYQARGLARWAAVMRMMSQATDVWCSVTFNRIESVKVLRDLVLKRIAVEKNVDARNYYGLNLGNPEVFARRIKEFSELGEREALNSLVSGRFSNMNALVRTFDHEAVLFDLYSKAQKLDLRETHRRYVTIMLENGVERKDCVGYEAARLFLMRDDIQAKLAESRHGKKYAEEKYKPFHLRKRPEVALEMVSGDGIWFGLPVKGVKRTWDYVTKQFVEEETITKLISFIWYDVASGAVVGWKHNYGRGGETNEMIRSSFRRIGEMTGGYFPTELQMDRKSTKNKHIQSFINRLGIESRDKRPHNPKDSMAERFHKELNKLLRAMSPHWLNITNNTIDFVHNPDAIDYNKEKAIDAGKAVALIDAIFTIYNNTAQHRLGGLSPFEYMKEHISPKAKQYTDFSMNMIFNETTVTTVRNGVFKLDFEKTEYEYEVPNWHQVIGNTAKENKVRVYFNEKAMGKVQICSFTDENNPGGDKYLCECETAQRYNMSVVGRTSGESRIIGHHEKRKRLFEDAMQEAQTTYTEYAADMGSALESNQDFYKEHLSSVMFAKFKEVENKEAAERGVNLHFPQLTQEIKNTKELRAEYSKLILNSVDLSIYED